MGLLHLLWDLSMTPRSAIVWIFFSSTSCICRGKGHVTLQIISPGFTRMVCWTRVVCPDKAVKALEEAFNGLLVCSHHSSVRVSLSRGLFRVSGHGDPGTQVWLREVEGHQQPLLLVPWLQEVHMVQLLLPPSIKLLDLLGDRPYPEDHLIWALPSG